MGTSFVMRKILAAMKELEQEQPDLEKLGLILEQAWSDANRLSMAYSLARGYVEKAVGDNLMANCVTPPAQALKVMDRWLSDQR